MPAARSTALVWFRQDLRLADNPALNAAIEKGYAVVPVFIHAPDEEGAWPPGGASKWWLHQSLKALEANLREAGSRLILRPGPTPETLSKLVRETGAKAVFWNRRYEPAIIARDTKLKESLQAEGIAAESFSAALLHEPWTIQNQSKKPFQVFTPFWRHCLTKSDPSDPLPTPRNLAAPEAWPKSVPLAEFKLEPHINWADAFPKHWEPGAAGAQKNLVHFLRDTADNYDTSRDHPATTGTSRLSPHLHFGEISPRQIWQAVRQNAEKRQQPLKSWREGRYLTEIGWREFAHHLLYHFPHTPEEPLRPEFREFPWQRNAEWLGAWQRGQTGYPLVDAGMRELWTTGWMHNRVRMVVASFLVKHLRITWLEGARWFWDTLVDADLANNTLGWQWSAGCGADAAPYFRIFNPVAQGEKFDPDGEYVRRWVPELNKLPNQWIHQPWKAPAAALQKAGVQLGREYPEPMVNHFAAREAALAAYDRARGKSVSEKTRP